MFNKIQTRISLLLTVISLTFIIGLILHVNSEQDKFENVLRERAREKNQLVERVISTLGENLRTLSYDYSYWDDMVNFLSTRDRDWAYVNIVAVMPTFNAHTVWVYKKDLTLVYSTDSLNAEGLYNFPVGKETLHNIVKNNWFPHFFVETKQGLMEVRGAPIQPSADIKRKTVPQGFLFSGRIWDRRYLDELAALSGSDQGELALIGSENKTPPQKYPGQVVNISRQVLRGWDGRPIAVFKTTTEFPIMEKVLRKANNQYWITIIFAFVIIGAISLFLLKYVNTPLKKISGSIEQQDPQLIHSLLKNKTEFGKLSILVDDFFSQKSNLVREIDERKAIQSELQEKIASLQLLKVLHNAFQRALDLDQIYDLVYDTLPHYLGSRGVHRANLLIYDAAANSFIMSFIGRKLSPNNISLENLQTEQPLPLESSISGKCFITGEIISIEDCSESPLIPKKYAEELHLKACISIPVKSDHKTLGVLRLDNTENPHTFTKPDIDLFQMISEQLGVVLQNAMLFAEQKKTEKELRRSEALYRTIFESTGTASIIIEDDDTIVLLNTESERLSGYKSGELAGRKWTEFVIPEDLEKIKYRDKCEHLGPDQALNKHEIRMWDRNCNIGYYIFNLNTIPGTQRSIVSLIDITERIRAEEELRKFSYVVENTPVSVMITDPEGVIQYVNPYCLNVTGYPEDEVLGQNPRFLKSGETSVEEYKKLWDTIKSGNQWRGEFHNKKKCGELYWEIVSISPIKNEKGEIIHFIGIREDITEWKDIETELKTAKEKAEASDRLKSEFLAQMSHEIRTPINTILNFSSLIRSELEDKVDDEMKFCFKNVSSAGERIIRTIDLILNMSELQTGSYEYSPRSLDIYTDVLEVIYSNSLHSAKEKKLQLLLNRDTLETGIVADEYSVFQILTNLIDNAIKYTNKGSVSVTVSRNYSSSLMVEVADTGIGINKEYLPQLFDPFSQEEQGYTRRFEGNGLGLALVKKYCELNDLQIQVETEKNCGTTFRVIFPQ